MQRSAALTLTSSIFGDVTISVGILVYGWRGVRFDVPSDFPILETYRITRITPKSIFAQHIADDHEPVTSDRDVPIAIMGTRDHSTNAQVVVMPTERGAYEQLAREYGFREADTRTLLGSLERHQATLSLKLSDLDPERTEGAA